jgi:hypothetical protein
MGEQAHARDRGQNVVGIDIGADLAGGDRSLEQTPKGGSDSLLEVRAQVFEGWVSRAQGRDKPAFGGEKGRVSLHPLRQRFTDFVYRLTRPEKSRQKKASGAATDPRRGRARGAGPIQ